MSFIVSVLTFRSLIHFEFIFVYGVRKCSSFILLQVVDQFSQHHLLKRLSFFHCISLPPLSKIRWPYARGFISGLSILIHWSIYLSLCQYHTVLMTWIHLNATLLFYKFAIPLASYYPLILIMQFILQVPIISEYVQNKASSPSKLISCFDWHPWVGLSTSMKSACVISPYFTMLSMKLSRNIEIQIFLYP